MITFWLVVMMTAAIILFIQSVFVAVNYWDEHRLMSVLFGAIALISIYVIIQGGQGLTEVASIECREAGGVYLSVSGDCLPSTVQTR